MHHLHIIIYIAALLAALPHSGAQAQGSQFTVVLDAGHGGKDPGAQGRRKGSNEKTINLGIVREVGRLLQQNCPDVRVLYTRQTDVFVPLDRRAEIANKAKADLFVSVHVNALPKGARKAAGVQSYTLTLRTAGTNLEVEKRENSVIQYEEDGASKYSFAQPGSAESDIMFELMQDRDMKESVAFAELAQREMVRTGGRNDMGVLQANLAVLRLTYMPSVLLEVGYISTPSEETYLNSSSGQATLAKCIYNAIARYKAKHTGKLSALQKVEPAQAAQPASQTEDTATAPAVPSAAAPQQQATAPAVPSAAAPQQPTAAPLYRVQILSGTVRLKQGDRQFKGLQVDVHQEGKTYKYTYGTAATLQEAKRLRQSILDKFPQAFIVQW